MANAFVKPTEVVDTAIQMLQNELVLSQLVWLNGIGDFANKFNDTITVRVPAPSRGHTRILRGTGAQRNLTVSDLTEDSFPVTLTDVAYHLAMLTDEEMTLDLRNFAQQVLARQVRGVADILEEGVRDTIQNAPYAAAGAVHEVAPVDFFKGVNSARRAMDEDYIPADRILLVGTAVEEQILNDDRFIRYDSQGQAAVSALQEARLGRIYGYDIIVSPLISHGAAYMFHRTAFIMATRTPALPLGAVQAGAVASSPGQNFALRWLVDYDPTITSNRSLVDCYVGYKAVTDPNGVGFVRARKIHLIPASVDVQVGAGDSATVSAADPTAQLKVVDANGDDVTANATFAVTSGTSVTVNAAGLVTRTGTTGASTITASYVTPSGTRTDTQVITNV